MCVYTHTHIFANYDSCSSVSSWSKKPSRQVSDVPGTLEAPAYAGQEEAGAGLPIIPLP